MLSRLWKRFSFSGSWHGELVQHSAEQEAIHEIVWLRAHAALLLAAPLVSGFVAPTQANLSDDELRVLAPAPSFPRTLADVTGLPPQIDAWLHDHFGLRSTFIHAYALLTQVVLRSGNSSVFIGRKGSMFYCLDNAIQQSAGLIRRDEQVTETANMLAAMKDALVVRGARVVVASPPNAATIYGNYLPHWARNNGQSD